MSPRCVRTRPVGSEALWSIEMERSPDRKSWFESHTVVIRPGDCHPLVTDFSFTHYCPPVQSERYFCSDHLFIMLRCLVSLILTAPEECAVCTVCVCRRSFKPGGASPGWSLAGSATSCTERGGCGVGCALHLVATSVPPGWHWVLASADRVGQELKPDACSVAVCPLRTHGALTVCSSTCLPSLSHDKKKRSLNLFLSNFKSSFVFVFVL